MRSQHTPEPIQRALDHHVTTGALGSVKRDAEAVRTTWVVTYDSSRPPLHLSASQAQILCIGLARGGEGRPQPGVDSMSAGPVGTTDRRGDGPARVNPSERLLDRLRRECGLDVPAGTQVNRTYAGTFQRRGGAWSWFAFGPDGEEICGSHYPIKVLLRSKRLAVAFDVDNDAPSVDPV